MRLGRRLRTVTRHESALLLRALSAVCLARGYLVTSRHHALRRLIDAYPVTHAAAMSDLTEVAWSVAAAARLVPGATCLTQASAGQMLLAKRGLGSTIRLSVPVGTKGGTLAPHAWLLSGETIVLGGSPAEYSAHRPLHDFDRRPEGLAT